MGCGGLLVTAGLQEEQVVTWFQFHGYLQRQSISDLEKHLAQLTKEGRAEWGQTTWKGSYSTPCPFWLGPPFRASVTLPLAVKTEME